MGLNSKLSEGIYMPPLVEHLYLMISSASSYEATTSTVLIPPLNNLVFCGDYAPIMMGLWVTSAVRS